MSKRHRRGSAWTCVRALLWLSWAAALPAHANPTDAAWSRFFQDSQDANQGALDFLAPQVPTLELPLAARAVDRWEAEHDTVRSGAYPSFARWHFWMGEHWDRNHSGLWGVDPTWTPGSEGRQLDASAELSSLQLVQLEALANLAFRRGLVYDALVWWTERRQLSRRLGRELYDSLGGAYVDLDSTGTVLPAEGLSGLLPLAFDAPHITGRSLLKQREYWQDIDARVIQLAENATSESSFSRGRRAALALHAAEVLFDHDLERELRNALRLRGVEIESPLMVAASISPLPLDTSALHPLGTEAVYRASTAVRFLRRGGFVPTASHLSLEADLDSLAAANAPLGGPTVDRLTEALVDWRSRLAREERGTWRSRRAGLKPVDPPGSVFHLSDVDATHWIQRALDLLAEVVVEHALRSRTDSAVRARFAEDLRGTGDSTVLEVRVPLDLRSDPPAASALLWTDGITVLSPLPLDWSLVEGGFDAVIPRVPDTKGLWRAIVTGWSPGPRIAPSLAVVEPVVAEVVARTPSRAEHPHRIRLRSQVSYPVRGAIEIDAPVLWTIDPSARITYALGPGETRIIDVHLRPDDEAAPGSYPVHWHFYDGHTELRAQTTRAVRPFRWVTIGPFAGQADDFELPSGLLPVDFSRSLRGRDGPLRWRRLPARTLGPEGELQLGNGWPGWSYALTAFTTGSRMGRISVRAATPWVAYVNGERVLRSVVGDPNQGAAIELRQGANQVLVGSWQEGLDSVPCAVEIESIEGTPLAGADDTLEMTLEGFAYVDRGEGTTAGVEQSFERDTMRLIPLSYGNPAATSVSVVGSFNGWSPDRTPMARDEDGKWVAGIRVPPGRFEYKFAVDGQHWIADPANPHRVADGFGGQNSILVVE